LLGTQGALVETLDSVEKDVELEIMVVESGEGTVGTVELEQEQRHALVRWEEALFDD